MGRKPGIMAYSIARDYIKKIGGDDALRLVEIVKKKKKNVTDEVIGKRMTHLKITEIRALLNRLHFHGIAAYQKSRDSRSGWYSYTWEIKDRRIAELLIEEHSNTIENLEKKMNYEQEHEFYSCPKECDNIAFEIAAEYHFKCPVCGANMDRVNTAKRIRKLKNMVKKTKSEIEAIKTMI